jgi:glycosyltransferase involved in cell wall biosynthesis
MLIGPMMMRVGAEAVTGTPETGSAASVMPKYVLALGTGDPKKGLDSLLAAWRLAEVSDHLQLVLFGSSWKGKGRPWIERNIRELSLENVVHVGPVSDAALGTLYRNAAAFVFPSYFEGLGLPPAEFCLAGDGPLIVRDIPALREIYGDVAHLFASDDELASLLRSVADDKLDPPVSPTSRRETLRRRLDSDATFARLWQAIQGPIHP